RLPRGVHRSSHRAGQGIDVADHVRVLSGDVVTIGVGSRLGSYEIVALLGAGGMGQVYRARDTRLERDVALKVLPDSVTHDPDRLARFRREAQVLAALNHPHIG